MFGKKRKSHPLLSKGVKKRGEGRAEADSGIRLCNLMRLYLLAMVPLGSISRGEVLSDLPVSSSGEFQESHLVTSNRAEVPTNVLRKYEKPAEPVLRPQLQVPQASDSVRSDKPTDDNLPATPEQVPSEAVNPLLWSAAFLKGMSPIQDVGGRQNQDIATRRPWTVDAPAIMVPTDEPIPVMLRDATDRTASDIRSSTITPTSTETSFQVPGMTLGLPDNASKVTKESEGPVNLESPITATISDQTAVAELSTDAQTTPQDSAEKVKPDSDRDLVAEVEGREVESSEADFGELMKASPIAAGDSEVAPDKPEGLVGVSADRVTSTAPSESSAPSGKSGSIQEIDNLPALPLPADTASDGRLAKSENLKASVTAEKSLEESSANATATAAKSAKASLDLEVPVMYGDFGFTSPKRMESKSPSESVAAAAAGESSLRSTNPSDTPKPVGAAKPQQKAEPQTPVARRGLWEFWKSRRENSVR